MSAGQVSGRNTKSSVPGQGGNRKRVHWWRRMDYGSFQRKIAQYNIQSVRAGNVYIITSNNIRLEVSPMDFSRIVTADFDEMNARLSRWREAKARDDLLAYGKDTPTLFAQANRAGYMGSEQHTMWAMGASARTGCFIPPEFFFENEGYGGTAGNGPNILPGGDAREPLSTIAMGHDSDWMIGRLFAMGPLARLNTVTPRHQYQIQRMGSAGLFNAGVTNELLARDNRIPFISDPHTAEERRTNPIISSILDEAAAGDRIFRGYELYLHQGVWGWRVHFTDSYQRFAYKSSMAIYVGLLGGLVGMEAIRAAGRNYIWSGYEPATQGKNDVRVHNDARAPGFPE